MDETDALEEVAVVTLEFERKLASLLRSAFAEGAPVEGTWEITSQTDAVPEWTVEIVKSAGADPDYDPEVIE